MTVRRVEVVGGSIGNVQGSGCYDGMLLEDVTVRGVPGGTTDSTICQGGYTARNVLIDGTNEGFRVGGADAGCGPVVVENSYVRTVAPAPEQCADWHGDGLQGWIGPHLTIRNTVLEFDTPSDCFGNSPFFYPGGQGNTAAVVDGLIVSGGGYSFDLGTPGSVQGLYVVDGSWTWGPVAVACQSMSSWQAFIAQLDSNGQPQVVRSLGCA